MLQPLARANHAVATKHDTVELGIGAHRSGDDGIDHRRPRPDVPTR